MCISSSLVALVFNSTFWKSVPLGCVFVQLLQVSFVCLNLKFIFICICYIFWLFISAFRYYTFRLFTTAAPVLVVLMSKYRICIMVLFIIFINLFKHIHCNLLQQPVFLLSLLVCSIYMFMVFMVFR